MIEKHLQLKLSRGIKLVFPLECSFKKGESQVRLNSPGLTPKRNLLT